MRIVRTATAVLILIPFLAVVLALRAQTDKTEGDADDQPIDLSNFYGKVAGTEGDTWFSHPDWRIVPKGLQNFDGILFDVSGTLLLKSTNMPQLKEAVRNIPVKKTCRCIHLLHGVGYSDEDGTPIATLEIHYASGEKREFPIAYGVHVRNWWKEKREKVSDVSDPGSAVAWSGQGEYPPPDRASVRLYRSTFVNPLPKELIDHIDFVSKNSKAIPCIVSVPRAPFPPIPSQNCSNKNPATRSCPTCERRFVVASR